MSFSVFQRNRDLWYRTFLEVDLCLGHLNLTLCVNLLDTHVVGNLSLHVHPSFKPFPRQVYVPTRDRGPVPDVTGPFVCRFCGQGWVVGKSSRVSLRVGPVSPSRRTSRTVRSVRPSTVRGAYDPVHWKVKGLGLVLLV